MGDLTSTPPHRGAHRADTVRQADSSMQSRLHLKHLLHCSAAHQWHATSQTEIVALRLQIFGVLDVFLLQSQSTCWRQAAGAGAVFHLIAAVIVRWLPSIKRGGEGPAISPPRSAPWGVNFAKYLAVMIAGGTTRTHLWFKAMTWAASAGAIPLAYALSLVYVFLGTEHSKDPAGLVEASSHLTTLQTGTPPQDGDAGCRRSSLARQPVPHADI